MSNDPRDLTNQQVELFLYYSGRNLERKPSRLLVSDVYRDMIAMVRDDIETHPPRAAFDNLKAVLRYMKAKRDEATARGN